MDPWTQKLVFDCSEDITQTYQWGRGLDEVQTFKGNYKDYVAWMFDNYMTWRSIEKQDWDPKRCAVEIEANLEFDTGGVPVEMIDGKMTCMKEFHVCADNCIHHELDEDGVLSYRKPILSLDLISDIFTFRCVDDTILMPKMLLQNDLEFIQSLMDPGLGGKVFLFNSSNP